jgi:MFS family permease
MPALGEGARLAIIVAVMTLCTLPLLLMRATRHAPAFPATTASTDTEGALSRRDLFIAGAARLFMQITSAVTLAYLLYYFESIVADQRHLPANVGTLMAVGFILSLPVAVVLGRLSDGVARRKPFLLVAALVSAAGLTGMAFATGWWSGAAAFCVYAIGSAVFAGLHAAFAMQLLPQPNRRGRDLGLLNLTNTLPSLLGPPLTWLLATPHDFTVVMLLLAAFSLCGGACILLVGSRR